MSSSNDQASTSATTTRTTETTKMRMLTLVTSEGDKFEVEESIATKESVTIKNSLLDSSDNDPLVPLFNVNAPVLTKIIEYWNRPNEESTTHEEKEQWDKEFMKGMEKEELLNLVLALSYLDSKALFDVACQTVADKIKNMTPEEVRNYFGIECDFTPEEEAAVRAENSWTFH